MSEPTGARKDQTKSPRPTPSRRDLLRGLPAAGLTVASGGVAAAATDLNSQAGRGEEGYRETEYVRRYYRLSRF